MLLDINDSKGKTILKTSTLLTSFYKYFDFSCAQKKVSLKVTFVQTLQYATRY